MPGELLLEYDQVKKALGFEKAKPVPYPIQTIREVTALAERYSNPESRFLCSFLYLSGQRISEFLATRRSDISFQDHNGEKFLVINSLTEKNREYARRVIPIFIGGDELPMVNYVIEYLKGMPDDQLLCSKTRTNCWNLLSVQAAVIDVINQDKTMSKKAIQIYPHFLRHCRASHLVMYHGYDIYKLMEFFGWRSPLTPSIYAKMNWKSLANSMIHD